MLGVATLIRTCIRNAYIKWQCIFFPYQGPAIAMADINNSFISSEHEQKPLSLQDLFGTSLLWAVPKHRKTIQKRRMSKFGRCKMIQPKDYLLPCNVCGHFHLAHTVCGNCYEKVKEETLQMQEAIKKAQNWDPIEKEVLVVYKGEHYNNDIEKKQIVEIERERPPWFPKNLLAKENVGRLPKSDISDPVLQPVIKDK